MNRKIKTAKKLALLKLIKQKKDILFTSLQNNKVNKLLKQAAWEEVLIKAQSLQLASAQKTWVYARDNLFGLWKSRTLSKRYRARKTGSAGRKDCVMDACDLAILDILKSDSDVVDELSPESDSTTSRMAKETHANLTPQTRKRKRSTEFPSEALDREKKYQLELLQLEVYYKKLECLKLERELHIPPSAMTMDIVPVPKTEESYNFEL